MQLLKLLVIVMGILILLGMGLLAYGLVNKTNEPIDQKKTLKSSDVGSLGIFNDLSLTGNTGCRISKTETVDYRLIISLTSVASDPTTLICEKIIIIDVRDGTLIGSVTLQP